MRVENEQISCGKSCGNHSCHLPPMEYFYFRFNSCSLKAFRSAWVTQTVQPRISQNKHSWTSSLACQSTLYVFCCCQANSVPVGSRNHIITETSSSSTQSEKHFHFSGNIPWWKSRLCHSFTKSTCNRNNIFSQIILKVLMKSKYNFFGLLVWIC